MFRGMFEQMECLAVDMAKPGQFTVVQQGIGLAGTLELLGTAMAMTAVIIRPLICYAARCAGH